MLSLESAPMTRAVRVAINGAAGRMGSALCALLVRDARFALLHAVVSPDSARIGTPVCADAPAGLRCARDWRDAPAVDVVIDFSTPVGLGAALAHCLAGGTALLTGTTGYDAAMDARLIAASARLPCCALPISVWVSRR
jgi:4-hydroxy-tetrahydrodipicolinate reductase